MRKFLSRLISKRDIPGILTVLILGSLNHFLYDWTGGLAAAALFCPINESVWEHLKLLYFPFLLFSLWIFYTRRPRADRFFFCQFLGVLCGMIFTLTAFYTYTGIFGRDFLIADLLIFALSIVLSFAMARLSGRVLAHFPSVNLIFVLWLGLTLCFFVFTCFPPELPLFFPYG